MALQRLTIKGYGQIEINNCAFRRDGRIEAQCAPDATDFATKKLENGMILAIDNVTRTVKLDDGQTALPLAINYTAEHMYDERANGLKDFYLNGKDDFYPRLGYLAVGDKFTTNCVCYDTTEFADDTAFKTALAANGTTPLYGTECANGAIKVTATTTGARVILKVIAKTTMPDGTDGVKFQVYELK